MVISKSTINLEIFYFYFKSRDFVSCTRNNNDLAWKFYAILGQ